MWSLSRSLYAKIAVLWLAASIALRPVCDWTDCGDSPVVARVAWLLWPLWRLMRELGDQPDATEAAHMYWLQAVFNDLVSSLVWAAVVSGAVVLIHNALLRLKHR